MSTIAHAASRVALVVALIAVTLALFGTTPIWTTPASADTTYVPSPNNGQKVYLSRACHDRGTGHCNENFGCSGHIGENEWSRRFSSGAAFASTPDGSPAGLVDREYIVRIGNGLTSQNIANSNAWGAKMHIPLHSNAGTWDCSSPYYYSHGGTWGMYVSTNGSQLAAQLRDKIGVSSPGTNDKIVKRTDLGELNQTTAVAGYLEAGFHTFRPDMNWLHAYANNWGWRLGYAVDSCRGTREPLTAANRLARSTAAGDDDAQGTHAGDRRSSRSGDRGVRGRRLRGPCRGA